MEHKYPAYSYNHLLHLGRFASTVPHTPRSHVLYGEDECDHEAADAAHPRQEAKEAEPAGRLRERPDEPGHGDQHDPDHQTLHSAPIELNNVVSSSTMLGACRVQFSAIHQSHEQTVTWGTELNRK